MKAAFYARVSTEDQRERQTIQTQRDFAERYFELNGIECADWFLDAGVSGMKPLPERPEGSRLLYEAGNGRKWDTLFVYRLDRLGRDPRDTLNSVDALEKAGVRLRSMTEPFDTSDPTGRCLLTMLSAFARLERDSIVARSKAGSERGAREGRWLGGQVPYGYTISRADGVPRLALSEELIPGHDLSEVDVVRLLYRMLLDERKSPCHIAEHLNALGVPTKRAGDSRHYTHLNRPGSGLWSDRNIRKMLVSTVYHGLWVYGKNGDKTNPIEVECPAIIDRVVWESACRRLQANETFGRRTGKREYLLRGLCRCARCQLGFHGMTVKRHGREYIYYVCRGKAKDYGERGIICPTPSVPVSLEDIVWSDVEAFLRNPAEVLDSLLSEVGQETALQRLRNERDAAQRTLTEKAEERARVLALYRRGRIDDETLDQQLTEIDEEEASAREVLKGLTQALDQAEGSNVDYASAEGLLRALGERLDGPVSPALKRQIIEELVVSAWVDTVEEEGRDCTRVTVLYRFLPVPGPADPRSSA